MDSALTPIVRGEFQYQDTLFVDVGRDGRRHPRASESELRDLLNGKTLKDQVAHWYEAQLIHYGLQRSKEKNTAKVRLNQALNQGGLNVPSHIADMEAQMKREWATAMRKAKTKAKSESEARPTPSKSNKRPNKEDLPGPSSKKTKISVTVGDLKFDMEHDDSTIAKGKRTSTAVESSKARAINKGIVTKSASIRTPKQTKTQAAKATDSPAKPPASRSKTTVIHNEPQMREPRSKAAAEATASKSKAGPKSKIKQEIKKEPRIKAEPNPKIEKTKKDPSWIKDEDGGIKLPNVLDNNLPRYVTGIYDIVCPQMTRQLPDEANNMRLLLCIDHENDRIWASFEFAMKSGVIRIDNCVNNTDWGVDSVHNFGWRARDGFDGHLTFGKGCFGRLEFYGRDRIAGSFFGLMNDELQFDGQRRPGPLWCGKSAYMFQREWDEYVTEAYGR